MNELSSEAEGEEVAPGVSTFYYFTSGTWSEGEGVDGYWLVVVHWPFHTKQEQIEEQTEERECPALYTNEREHKYFNHSSNPH